MLKCNYTQKQVINQLLTKIMVNAAKNVVWVNTISGY